MSDAPAQPRTICVKCKHHMKQRTDDGLGWFVDRCKHSAVNDCLGIDLVTGLPVTRPYAHCRDINTHGECPHYEAK